MKRNGLTAILVIMGIILSAAPACRRAETPEEKAAREMREAEPKQDNTLEGVEGVKNAILGYNQAVIHGNMKTDYLRFVGKYASDYEASRVVAFVTEDRAKGRVMRSRLSELIFENITAAGDTMEARTSERWEYDYLDLETGKPRDPLREISYKLEYTLVRQEGKWLVAKLEQLEKPLVTVYSPPRAFEP
jgi:hypothetical protein